MMPIIVCAGGPHGQNKMDFIRQWTRPDNRGSQDHSVGYSACDGLVLIFDTPTTHRNYQDDQNADSIFQAATVILDFGDWEIEEVPGWQKLNLIHIMKYRGDPLETLKRILQRHGINVPVHPPSLPGDSDRAHSVCDHVSTVTQGSQGSGAERPDDLEDGHRMCTSESFGGALHGGH